MRSQFALCTSLCALLVSSSTAQATIIEDLIGEVKFSPVTVTLDNPDAATNINGVVHVVGSDNGQAARQLIDLTTGAVGQVEYFDSFLSAGGQNGDADGKIFGVTQLANGDVLYVGHSAGTRDSVQPTYWIDPTLPQGGVGSLGQQTSGSYLAVSSEGVFVGPTAVAGLFYGTPGTQPTFVAAPGFAVDITTNSEFVVGTGGLVWAQDQFGGYSLFSTDNFDFAVSNGTPNWQGVAIDPIVGDAVFAGTYFDLNTFSDSVGFWRADGTFLGSTSGIFRDFEVWEGQLVAAVAGFTDSTLIAISDFSSIALASILGVESLIFDDGLFVGSAGFLAAGANGAFITTYQTQDPNGGGGGGTEVPEPSSLLLLGTAAAFLKRRKVAKLA